MHPDQLCARGGLDLGALGVELRQCIQALKDRRQACRPLWMAGSAIMSPTERIGIDLNTHASQDSTPPVVLVHGFLTRPGSNAYLARWLRRQGRAVAHVRLPGLNTGDICGAARQVAVQVAALRRRFQVCAVDLVGVSMGGLIGYEALKHAGGDCDVRRFVSLAAPFGGVDLARHAQRLPGIKPAALRQLSPDSPLICALQQGTPAACELVTVSVAGDPLVAASRARLPGAVHVHSPHGRWPFGHHELILRRENLNLLFRMLSAPLAELDASDNDGGRAGTR